MLLGIVGAALSGKQSIADYLILNHGFIKLSVNPDLEKGLCFYTLSDAVHYATGKWNDRFLILNIDHHFDYESAFKRPFFLLVGCQAPTLVRFNRQLKEELLNDDITLSALELDSSCSKTSYLDLENFLIQDDRNLYQQRDNGLTLSDFLKKATISILNDGVSLKQLHHRIDSLDLVNTEHTRPSWDTYFMALCELASKRSNCMKRRVGCILVSESRVISTGYNGTPRNVKNCNQGGCPRCNGNAPCGSSLDSCICMHAEEVSDYI